MMMKTKSKRVQKLYDKGLIGRSFWVKREFDDELKKLTKLTGLNQSTIVQMAITKLLHDILNN